jgi:acetyltransferase-like isoleucine patch superfamily enzyme
MDGIHIHPHALVEADEIGAGTRVWAFAHLLPGAVVGSDCNICDHAFVEGGARVGDRVTVKNAVLIWTGVTVEDDVFLGPNMVFTNDMNPRAHVKKGPEALERTLVREGATIGANATIRCGATVGAHAFVGAGTMVLDDVPAHALVVGNPARQIGWVCRCGVRLDGELACPDCGRRYQPAAAGGLEPVAATVTAPLVAASGRG